MKKMMFAAMLLVSVLSSAYAEEVKPTAEQFHVAVGSVDTSGLGADVKVSPSDYPNGVYVLVKEAFGERPVSASIFADKLRAKGFKIAEKKDDADVIVRVISTTLNFKDIEQNSDSVSAQKIDGAIGTVGAAMLTGGLSLLVTDYSYLSNNKPVYTTLMVMFEPGKLAGKTKETFMAATTKADARNHLVTRFTFELMTDEWLKAHLHNDEAALATPASAAPATTKQ